MQNIYNSAIRFDNVRILYLGFSPNENNRIEYFQSLKNSRWKKSIFLFLVSIEKLKTLKYHTFSKKH